MALPIRSIPVLEGEVARRFIKNAEEAYKKRGTVHFSQEEIDAYRAIVEKSRKNFTY